MKKLIISSMIMLSSLGMAQNLILDGQSIALNQSVPISIDSTSGNVIITSANGNLSCEEIGDPPTLTLVADQTSINSGDSVELTWTVGNNATTCQRSGGWSGTIAGGLVSNGPHSEIITNITNTTTFSMTCSNAFGSSGTRSVTVNVNGSQNCPTQPPILNGAEDRTIRLIPGAPFNGPGVPSNPAEYNGLYTEIVNGGAPWPGDTGGQTFATLSANQYAAMQFNTNNLNLTGKVTMVPPGNGQGPGSNGVTIAISECPGDFSTTINQDRCVVSGGSSISLRWSQDPGVSANTHCKLQKNQTYYFNIVHSITPANNFATTACTNTSGYCGIIFNNQ